ncbi:MAG: heparinase II/III-family protein [bacterium]|nr:heparinase II/III-family protein [bacterium]
MEDDLMALDGARTNSIPDIITGTSALTLAAMRGIPSIIVEHPAQWRVLNNGGYLVKRFVTKGRNGHVTFDIGPLGYSVNPGHGHADAASFTLDIDDLPVIVDSGTHRYGSSEQWLRYKRARAHNTLWIDGEEPADLWQYFRWCDLPPQPDTEIQHSADGFELVITRRGYGARKGLVHERTVSLIAEHSMIIVDQVSNQTKCMPAWGIAFHVAPGWEVGLAAGSARLIQGQTAVDIEISGNVPVECRKLIEPISHNYGCPCEGTTVLASVAPGCVRGRLETVVRW